MNTGYDKPLYILPFDHRGTLQKNMFGCTGSLTDEDGRITRDAAVKEIARRYREWVDIFESARSASGGATVAGGGK